MKLPITAPPRLYTSEEDKEILRGIVIHKQSCSVLAEMLGRDRRSVNKRFKILISRGRKQKLDDMQGEPAAAAALSVAATNKKHHQQQQPSKKVVLLACKPYRVVGFTANGKPILDSQPAPAPLAASTKAKQLKAPEPKAVAARAPSIVKQVEHRKFTHSEDRDILQGIRAGIPASVVAAKQQRTEKDVQQRFVRIEAFEREMRVNSSRLKSNM